MSEDGKISDRQSLRNVNPSRHSGAMLADDATSSMLEEEKRKKNETIDIGIQAFYAVLQLGEG